MPEPPSSDSCEQSSWRPGHSQGIEIHMKALPHILAQTAISHDFSQVMGGGGGKEEKKVLVIKQQNFMPLSGLYSKDNFPEASFFPPPTEASH